MTNINYDELDRIRIELLDVAQQKIEDAIFILDKIFKRDGNANAYLIAHLKIMVSENHGFLSRDLNLDMLRRRIEEEGSSEYTIEDYQRIEKMYEEEVQGHESYC